MRQFKLSSLATFAACGAFIVQAVRAPRDVTQGSDASTTLTTAEKQSSLSTTTAVISSTGDGTTGADYTTGNSATITSSATGDSTAAANSTSVDSTRTTVTAPAVTGNSSSASNASTPTSTTIASAPLNTSAAGDGGNATSADHLPLQPKITPGLGVAGVVLIIFGAIYGLIGIRQSWIHVFLSAAFLGGLAVSLLVIYLMSPPISTGIQGGYVVAAIMTGAVLGLFSIAFTEWTEGLGGLLGGFSFSMWLLTLKPGGLLEGTGPKAGLICALCAAFYALSFIKHVRIYVLIANIAFSGATALMLGIDCFTRVGLKEFWLYIWDINDNAFPTGTSTYPITRALRAETAVIPVVWLLGVLSQFRFWNVVSQRLKTENQIRDEEKLREEEADAEAGKRMGEITAKELSEWERMYGGDLPRRKVKRASTVNKISEPESGSETDISGHGQEERSAIASTGREDADDSKQNSTRDYASDLSSIRGSELDMLRARSRQWFASRKPNMSSSILAGPFVNSSGSISSVAGVKDEYGWSVTSEDHHDSKLKEATGQQYKGNPKSLEAQQTDDDQTEQGQEHVSVPVFAEHSLTESQGTGLASALPEAKGENVESQAEESPQERSINPIDKKVPSSSNAGQEQEAKKQELKEETLKRLSAHKTRIGSSYRTYEWTKQVPAGESLEAEPIQPLSTGSSETLLSDEATVPVHVDQLLQTPLNAAPPPAGQLHASTGEEAFRLNKHRRRSNAPKGSSHSRNRTWDSKNSTTPILGHRHRPDMHSRSVSLGKLPQPPTQQRGLRKMSIPQNANTVALGQQVVADKFKGPALQSSPSLLDIQDSMMRNRLSSISLPQDPWFANGKFGRLRSRSFAVPSQPLGSPAHNKSAGNVALSPRRASRERQQQPMTQASQVAYAHHKRRLERRPDSTMLGTPDLIACQSSSLGQTPRRPQHHDSSFVSRPQSDPHNDMHREMIRRMQARANENPQK